MPDRRHMSWSSRYVPSLQRRTWEGGRERGRKSGGRRSGGGRKAGGSPFALCGGVEAAPAHTIAPVHRVGDSHQTRPVHARCRAVREPCCAALCSAGRSDVLCGAARPCKRATHTRRDHSKPRKQRKPRRLPSHAAFLSGAKALTGIQVDLPLWPTKAGPLCRAAWPDQPATAAGHAMCLAALPLPPPLPRCCHSLPVATPFTALLPPPLPLMRTSAPAPPARPPPPPHAAAPPPSPSPPQAQAASSAVGS